MRKQQLSATAGLPSRSSTAESPCRAGWAPPCPTSPNLTPLLLRTTALFLAGREARSATFPSKLLRAPTWSPGWHWPMPHSPWLRVVSAAVGLVALVELGQVETGNALHRMPHPRPAGGHTDLGDGYAALQLPRSKEWYGRMMLNVVRGRRLLHWGVLSCDRLMLMLCQILFERICSMLPRYPDTRSNSVI